MIKRNINISIIGLGYVGLPLAVAFGRHRNVIGYDINKERIIQLKAGIDITKECCAEDLAEARGLFFTCDLEDTRSSTCYIVTVPTPVDVYKRPDLTPLIKASEAVGRVLKKGDIVIFESTVFPGCTEEECVPVLQKVSGLEYNKDFFCGYSPERINPGDSEHTLANIVKVTSGSTPDIADIIDSLYKEVIVAGTHKAESIKIAEAAKVIENTQRDLNIALINELSMIFNIMEIDTESVLKAAASKWNFLNFRPGLVGGHCIGVDPYYLTHKAQAVGYNPEVILAGRRVNDRMASYVATRLIKSMAQKHIQVAGARVLVMGLSFKEDCPDIRNTKVIDVISELNDYSCQVDVYDPYVDISTAQKELNLSPMSSLPHRSNANAADDNGYDAIIIALAHSEFKRLPENRILGLCKDPSVVYDLKYIFNPTISDIRL